MLSRTWFRGQTLGERAYWQGGRVPSQIHSSSQIIQSVPSSRQVMGRAGVMCVSEREQVGER